MTTSYIHGSELRPSDVIEAIQVGDEWVEIDPPLTVAPEGWVMYSLTIRNLRINRRQTAAGSPLADAGQVESGDIGEVSPGSLPDRCPECGEEAHGRRTTPVPSHGQTFVFPERGRQRRRMVATDEVRPDEPLPMPEVPEMAHREQAPIDPWEHDGLDDPADLYGYTADRQAHIRGMFESGRGGAA